jgi:hypothetical protein
VNQKIRPRVTGKIIRGIDECFFKYLLKPPAFMRNRSSPESLPHHQRLAAINELIKIYIPKNSLQKEVFFKKGSKITAKSSYKGKATSGVHITDLVWPSRFKPFWQDHHLSESLRKLKIDSDATLLEKFYRSKENLTCYARRFRKDLAVPRPTVVCFHGYGGGQFTFERWSFIVQTVIDKFDVLLMVLPHHAYRKERSRRYLPPRFPSADPRFTIEALRQVYFDYQGIKAHLLCEGVEKIGIAGMSLGGYCTALIAALDPAHEFYIPIAPMGRMSDLIEKQSRLLGSSLERELEKDCLDQLFSLVDPTTYKTDVGSKMTILVGQEDRVTGLEQAEILKNHFGANLKTFEGSHLIRKGFEKLWAETINQYSTACHS